MKIVYLMFIVEKYLLGNVLEWGLESGTEWSINWNLTLKLRVKYRIVILYQKIHEKQRELWVMFTAR